MSQKFNEAVEPIILPVKEILCSLVPEVKANIFEIRLRVNNPIILNLKNEQYFLSTNSHLQKRVTEKTVMISKNDIQNTFSNMCNHSVYSYQNEIKNGFVTLKGGHRVGICGTAVFDKNELANIRDINAMNIRIAHSVQGLPDKLTDILKSDFKGILIVGEPASGKTTILRNMAKAISDGTLGVPKNVVVIDERNEIASMHCGVPQIDMGFCDILSGYTKNAGFVHAIRALAPQVIICDEIGAKQDIKSIVNAVNSGVKIIATLHCQTVCELMKNSRASKILNTQAFDKIIFLAGRKKPSEIFEVYNTEDMKNESRRSNNINDFIDGDGIFGIA